MTLEREDENRQRQHRALVEPPQVRRAAAEPRGPDGAAARNAEPPVFPDVRWRATPVDIRPVREILSRGVPRPARLRRVRAVVLGVSARVSPNEPSAENAPPANPATTAHAVYVSASTVTADVGARYLVRLSRLSGSSTHALVTRITAARSAPNKPGCSCAPGTRGGGDGVERRRRR